MPHRVNFGGSCERGRGLDGPQALRPRSPHPPRPGSEECRARLPVDASDDVTMSGRRPPALWATSISRRSCGHRTGHRNRCRRGHAGRLAERGSQARPPDTARPRLGPLLLRPFAAFRWDGRCPIRRGGDPEIMCRSQWCSTDTVPTTGTRSTSFASRTPKPSWPVERPHDRSWWPPPTVGTATGTHTPDGDDPQSMLMDEFLPMVQHMGVSTDRVVAFGWSMGGYGALLLAETYPKRIRRVGARKPGDLALLRRLARRQSLGLRFCC